LCKLKKDKILSISRSKDFACLKGYEDDSQTVKAASISSCLKVLFLTVESVLHLIYQFELKVIY